ncbi:GNAT family N-acetyltransferase [Sphingomonas sp.]|jgi:GNAT superfamily N-acetyltransferase|uniref:GNAT family N-acetyltransferase n=1 Tax=Sphingomonas sp. TaxID=28214 RepID=UPI002EDB302F
MMIAYRWASENDIPAIAALMDRAIAMLQNDVLTPAQVVASHQVMGLDRQLVSDGTYLVAEIDGLLAGCGGWSRRATLFGGDAGVVPRDARMLDPAREPARIRAMYTDPAHVRRGIGGTILRTCEDAARGAGFARAELMATLAGVPLYRACGYTEVEAFAADVDGIAVPMMRMARALV